MENYTKCKYVDNPMTSEERDIKFGHLDEKYAPAMNKLAGNDEQETKK